MTEPSIFGLRAICRSGSSSARGAFFAPVFSSCFSNASRRTAFAACSSAMPPPEALPCASAARGVQDAVLLLLHLGLGRRAGVHDRDIAESLREALLRLLAVEVRVGVRRAIRTAGSVALTGPLELSALGGRFRMFFDQSASIASQPRRPRRPARCRRLTTTRPAPSHSHPLAVACRAVADRPTAVVVGFPPRSWSA